MNHLFTLKYYYVKVYLNINLESGSKTNCLKAKIFLIFQMSTFHSKSNNRKSHGNG